MFGSDVVAAKLARFLLGTADDRPRGGAECVDVLAGREQRCVRQRSLPDFMNDRRTHSDCFGAARYRLDVACPTNHRHRGDAGLRRTSAPAGRRG